MPAARSVQSLSAEDVTALRQTYRATADAALRTRCQMILLSHDHYSVADIARVTYFDQDTVLYWFDRYAASGHAGLADLPREGRPPKSDHDG